MPGRFFRARVWGGVATGATRLEGVVREGAASGAFEIGEQTPRDVALQIFSSVQGALLTGRLTSDPGVLDAVAIELRTYLGFTPKGREGESKPA